MELKLYIDHKVFEIADDILQMIPRFAVFSKSERTARLYNGLVAQKPGAVKILNKAALLVLYSQKKRSLR